MFITISSAMFCNFQSKKEEKTIKCEIKKLTFHEIQTRRRVANGTPLATLLRLNLQKKTFKIWIVMEDS